MSAGLLNPNDDIPALARAARAASRLLAKATAVARTEALLRMADALADSAPAILQANREDMSHAADAGLSPAMQDRLRLDEKRIAGMCKAVREIAAQPDPLGVAVKSWRRPNGLEVARVRIPLGVVAIIYEARPNVTSDAAAVCLRSGNAVILRGGSEAFRSSRAIARAIAEAVSATGLPAAAVQLLPTTDRAAMETLLTCEDDVDLVIPRGGEGLIRFVAERSRIPVIKHYKGNCHVFVDASADPEMALNICYNAKVQRPGVCNATETILIHKDIAARFLPALANRLSTVELRGDPQACALVPGMKPATDADWDTEYLDLICAVRVVSGLDEAIAHIDKHGSSHTESIVTSDLSSARRFAAEVGSSTVLVNASTRFADGGELGLGAEIGISTTRLHAYGPMGAEELTTTKFVVYGEGQIRQ
jgi:glutamate-5-semialdehyde dehydrogenase